MAIFDGRVIDPSEKDLARVLGKAMRSANTENKNATNRITRDGEFWTRFARDVLRAGAEGRRRSCRGGRAVPEVVAGWWTDPAGRKHVRVVGRTRLRYTRLRKETEMRELPPWWHVYPEAVLGVRGPKEKEGERYLAVCRCGAIGAPGALGWMGDTCGPCFDRRADGGTPAGGYGQFGGWAQSNARFAFTADGRHLVGQNVAGLFQKVNRDDGSAAVAKRRVQTAVAATGADGSGVTMTMYNGAVYRWPDGAAAIEPVLPSPRAWGRIAMTPDGARVALVNYQEAHVADLRADAPRYAAVPAPEPFTALQFDPRGTRMIAATAQGDLRAVRPETMASEVLRRDAFDGLPAGFGPPQEMAVAADGSAVLIHRGSYYHRGRATVRHVPLPAGNVVELRVPDWHHPSALAYGPDARHAVTAEAAGGWVGFWEVASGKSLGFVRAVMEDTTWRGGQIEFAPDGRALAVSYNVGHGAHGSTVAVWPWPDVLTAAGG